MSNMSYCRFENTDRDLAACESALDDMIDGEGAPLSRDELLAAKRLVARCQAILGMLADAGNLDVIDEEGVLDFDFNGTLDTLNDELRSGDRD